MGHIHATPQCCCTCSECHERLALPLALLAWGRSGGLHHWGLGRVGLSCQLGVGEGCAGGSWGDPSACWGEGQWQERVGWCGGWGRGRLEGVVDCWRVWWRGLHGLFPWDESSLSRQRCLVWHHGRAVCLSLHCVSAMTEEEGGRWAWIGIQSVHSSASCWGIPSPHGLQSGGVLEEGVVVWRRPLEAGPCLGHWQWAGDCLLCNSLLLRALAVCLSVRHHMHPPPKYSLQSH